MTMGVGLRARTKVLELPPDPNVRAPELYPDTCSLGAAVDLSRLTGYACARRSISPTQNNAICLVQAGCRTDGRFGQAV